jgi:hypothetical protein
MQIADALWLKTQSYSVFAPFYHLQIPHINSKLRIKKRLHFHILNPVKKCIIVCREILYTNKSRPKKHGMKDAATELNPRNSAFF